MFALQLMFVTLMMANLTVGDELSPAAEVVDDQRIVDDQQIILDSMCHRCAYLQKKHSIGHFMRRCVLVVNDVAMIRGAAATTTTTR